MQIVRDFPRKCKYGFTRDELAILITDLAHFDKWMYGQTMMVCSGRKFNHETREYEPDCQQPHGAITYVSDVEQYLSGGRPLD